MCWPTCSLSPAGPSTRNMAAVLLQPHLLVLTAAGVQEQGDEGDLEHQPDDVVVERGDATEVGAAVEAHAEGDEQPGQQREDGAGEEHLPPEALAVGEQVGAAAEEGGEGDAQEAL